jgi:hypothetical protein
VGCAIKKYILNKSKVNTQVREYDRSSTASASFPYPLKSEGFPRSELSTPTPPRTPLACGRSGVVGVGRSRLECGKASEQKRLSERLAAVNERAHKDASITLLDYSRIKGEKDFHNFRFYQSKDVIELTTYDQIQYKKKKQGSGGLRDSINQSSLSEEEKAFHKARELLKSAYRARKEIRLTINANIDIQGKEKAKFLTLTFKDDLRDLRKANRIFKDFIKRLNYSQGAGFKARYVAVPQFQDKRRKGVIHYHVIFFNLPFIKVSELRIIWGHGFIKINAIDDVDNVGAYMVGYMGKNFIDERFANEKRYFTSRGLQDPKEIRGYTEQEINFGNDWYVHYEVSYDNEYTGKIHYKQYRRKKTIDNVKNE